MPTRVTFITIGQTPRTDLVPELASWLPAHTTVREAGALDGLEAAAIAALEPPAGAARLVTRLADGRPVVVGHEWMRARLRTLLDELTDARDDVVVLLCTGEFPGLRGPGLFLDAQHLVDHGVAALCDRLDRIGLLLPLAEQAETFHYRPAAHQELRVSHASPYTGDRLEEAAAELADCDAIVMHCMGYTEAQRRRVARVCGRPTLLARRLVAAAVAQLL